MSALSIMLLGTKPFSLLSRLVNMDDKKKHYIHCFNVLDYEIPTKEEEVASRFYRAELRRAFRLLKNLDTEVPSSQLDLLKLHDVLDLDTMDLEVNAWIQQVFDHKVSYDATYKFLSGDLTKSNVELVPLLDDPVDMVIFKGDELAPLRYYYQKEKLLQRDNNEYFNRYSEHSAETMTISGKDLLKESILNAEAMAALENSQFLVILVSDIVSLAILSKMKQILKQFQDTPVPILLVLPEEVSTPASNVELDIFELLNLGDTIDKVIDNLSQTIDFIFSPKSAEELGEILLETGYQVEKNNVDNPLQSSNTTFIDFLHRLNAN